MKIRITRELAEKIKREVQYLTKLNNDMDDIIDVVLANNFEILESEND